MTQVQLPPAEFDHPFEGVIIYRVVKTADEIGMFCDAGARALACAQRSSDGRSCLIIKLPDEKIEATGVPVWVVMRHEIGHCNKWGADHAGARTWYNEKPSDAGR
jgi:hypothetical protein